MRQLGLLGQLQLILNELFPKSSIRAFPLNTNVVLTGHVSKETEIRQALDGAGEFEIRFSSQVKSHAVQQNLKPLHQPRAQLKILKVLRWLHRQLPPRWAPRPA